MIKESTAFALIALNKFNQVCQIMFENKDYPIQVLWYIKTVNRFIAIDYLKILLK